MYQNAWRKRKVQIMVDGGSEHCAMLLSAVQLRQTFTQNAEPVARLVWHREDIYRQGGRYWNPRQPFVLLRAFFGRIEDLLQPSSGSSRGLTQLKYHITTMKKFCYTRSKILQFHNKVRLFFCFQDGT